LEWDDDDFLLIFEELELGFIMKILTENLLKEYGFVENKEKSNPHVKVYTRDKVDISIKSDGIFYSNLGFDYPLRDTASLRKIYKEIKNEELK